MFAPINLQAQEFMRKAAELGYLEDINRELETRKNERRVALIETLQSEPKIEDTDAPNLASKAEEAAVKVQLAEEALAIAKREFTTLSQRAYGAQLQHGNRVRELERQIQECAPDFVIAAHEDLDVLDTLVQKQFRYFTEDVGGSFWRSRNTVMTSNGEEVKACREIIANAQKGLIQIVLSVASLGEVQEQVEKLFQNAKKAAFELGVTEQQFIERKSPTRHLEQAEDRVAKDARRKPSTREIRI